MVTPTPLFDLLGVIFSC